jgi:hypothetical protein
MSQARTSRRSAQRSLESRLSTVEQQVARVLALLEHPPTDDDAIFLAQLLPPIGAVFGSDRFTIGELRAHPNAGLRLVIAERSSTAIGQLFSRFDGRPVGGYVVIRAGNLGTRSLWKVQVVQGTCATPLSGPTGPRSVNE